MAKTICDWSKKDLEKNPERLHALTRNACFFCKKCGRVANARKALCRAESFPCAAKVGKMKIAA